MMLGFKESYKLGNIAYFITGGVLAYQQTPIKGIVIKITKTQITVEYPTSKGTAFSRFKKDTGRMIGGDQWRPTRLCNEEHYDKAREDQRPLLRRMKLLRLTINASKIDGEPTALDVQKVKGRLMVALEYAQLIIDEEKV